MCLPVHWHYFGLVAKFLEERLLTLGIIDRDTIALTQGINQPDLKWLGNVPVSDLVKLRLENENEDFRKRLKTSISELNDASLSNLNRVTSEISRVIASLLVEHDKSIRQLQDKYQSKYKDLAIAASVTLAAILVPALAPLVGVAAPLGIGGKYLREKISERSALDKASKSLMGVLSSAREVSP
jgi:hypothetical protein